MSISDFVRFYIIATIDDIRIHLSMIVDLDPHISQAFQNDTLSTEDDFWGKCLTFRANGTFKANPLVKGFGGDFYRSGRA